jgi:hypothetical protein
MFEREYQTFGSSWSLLGYGFSALKAEAQCMTCSVGRTTHDTISSSAYKGAAAVHDWMGILQPSRLQAASQANMKAIA